jgi:hypothetical protein
MSKPTSLATAQKLLVEFDVLLAGAVLHARRDRDASGFDRPFSEHRKFLEHEFQVAVGFYQIEHVGHGALAVAAIVVEELDHRDVALGIAEHHLMRRAKERRLVFRHRGPVLLGVGALLALLQLRHDVLHDFRMAEQIILDDRSDLFALIGGE